MKATDLYEKLEEDFIKPGITDEWFKYMGDIKEYICKSFQERSMGLVCDFTDTVNKVYSAVFPSDPVMKKIIADDTRDAMFFVHHPSTWDIRKAPNIFTLMNTDLLDQFKERKVAVYNLHHPLDNFSDYSTSATLAKALGMEIEKPFIPYSGTLAGVVAKTDLKTVTELQKRFSETVGHETKLYLYGDDEIRSGRVSVVGGGGHFVEGMQEVQKEDINVHITGITLNNDSSKETHEFDKENRISVIGGTHYSTEKFSCMEMCKYFEKQGLPCEFIGDEPVIEDM